MRKEQDLAIVGKDERVFYIPGVTFVSDIVIDNPGGESFMVKVFSYLPDYDQSVLDPSRIYFVYGGRTYSMNYDEENVTGQAMGLEEEVSLNDLFINYPEIK